MTNREIDELAKTIWDFHLLRQKLIKSDLILVLGSSDIRVAEYACDLFLAGWAPKILFSGGVAHTNDILAAEWGGITEAEKFAEVAKEKGIPRKNILIENESTNTGENITFSYRVLCAKNFLPQSIILVQKPYMERRAYATFRKQWPDQETKIIVTSPPIPYEAYQNRVFPRDRILNTIVGDLQRIKIYSEKGFQIKQQIPPNVWEAYEKLVDLGYTKHMVR